MEEEEEEKYGIANLLRLQICEKCKGTSVEGSNILPCEKCGKRTLEHFKEELAYLSEHPEMIKTEVKRLIYQEKFAWLNTIVPSPLRSRNYKKLEDK